MSQKHLEGINSDLLQKQLLGLNDELTISVNATSQWGLEGIYSTLT